MNESTTPTADERVATTIDKVCAVIPDYPEPGIIFRDLTPLFADGSALREVVDALLRRFEGQFDVVAGVEARGFLLASAAAYAAGVGVLPVRKEGKLPRETYAESYQLEYGTATLEIHRDDIPGGARVLVLDDILATGGTLGAAVKLVERAGLHVAGIGVVMELEGLAGRSNLTGHEVSALYTV